MSTSDIPPGTPTGGGAGGAGAAAGPILPFAHKGPAFLPDGSMMAPVRLTALLAALANPVRLRLVRELMDGRPRSIVQLARPLRKDPDLISKHLLILRRAGVLVIVQGMDRRYQFFYLPEHFRPAPGVLDFGVAVIRPGA